MPDVTAKSRRTFIVRLARTPRTAPAGHARLLESTSMTGLSGIVEMVPPDAETTTLSRGFSDLGDLPRLITELLATSTGGSPQ